MGLLLNFSDSFSIIKAIANIFRFDWNSSFSNPRIVYSRGCDGRSNLQTTRAADCSLEKGEFTQTAHLKAQYYRSKGNFVHGVYDIKLNSIKGRI